MNLNEINQLQERFGYAQMQELISSGQVWHFEGHMGREAMRTLESGICYLPEQSTRDYYGNHIPSRHEVEEGTTGSLQNCISFWEDESNYWEWELQLDQDEIS